MIKLEQIEKPKQLTIAKQKDFTEKFKTTRKNVWNRIYIKEQLLKMSHNKCCYCEIKLNIASNYVEVEHFLPKKEYKDLVVDWENLLPSCKRCNGQKGEHDTKNEPIINPTIQNPKEHLFVKDYRLYTKNNSKIGKTTIDLLLLNDFDRLVTPRFTIGNDINEKLDDILDLLNDYTSGVNKSVKRKNKIIERLQNIMKQAIPKAQFSAICSTIILTSPTYKKIKQELTNLNLWNNNFKKLEIQMKFCSLTEN